MAKYINAVKFEKYILERYNTMEMVGINQVVNFIHEQPIADAKEVKRGRFEKIGEPFVKRVIFEVKCPFCEAMGFSTDNFCANCGADMREVEVK